MTRLAIQQFFDAGGTLDELETTYQIKARRHGRYPTLVLLKYNQVASPFAERIVQECRGIVLDESDGWRVVSRAFDKFFNHGEGNAAEIDWPTASVQEKLDGSLCTIYWYRGEWHVATTGTPDACGYVPHDIGTTFSALFWSTYNVIAAVPPPSAIGYSFYFELTSPWNRVVVDHRETGITLLGARHLESGVEVGVETAREILGRDVPTVRSHPLGSFEEIAATFASINPLESEGYVVVDALFNRVKVKHPGYVALHHAVGSMNHRGLLEVARSGESSEVAASFPEIAARLVEMRSRIDSVVSELESDYARIKHIETQKDFALEAVKTKHSPALFQLRAGKVASIRDFLAKMHVDRLSDLLGYGAIVEAESETA